MKKKFGIILALASVGLACLAAGCSTDTELEKYQKKGYTVMVTYDANGGSFLSRQGVTLVDLFKPSDHVKEDGKVHIYLTEPTDLQRPTSGTGNVTLTKQEHFFAGWYQNCELRKNESDQVVDENGAALEEKDGVYYYVGTQTEAVPAYDYSGYWDFKTDTIDDEVYEMTLYAAWVPYYKFDYYYRVEGETNWSYLTSTAFDYKTTNSEGSITHDKDTIWVPDWKDGAMNHTYRYENNSTYEFPKVSGTTFKAAYLDENCERKIEGSYVHEGTLDLEKGAAINRVQNIYIEVQKGEHYKIETAEQFNSYASLTGYYEILADLDFKNGEVKWPNSFTAGEFKGQIYGSGGNVYTFKNVQATYSSQSAKQGGLFGKIAKDAIVKDVNFENATLNLAYVSTRMSETTFGFFAGNVDEEAIVSNVSIGGTLRLGEVGLALASDYKIHLIANGKIDGIKAQAIKLQIYGKKIGEQYQYAFNPDNVIVNEDQTITLDYSGKQKDYRRDNESMDIGTFEIDK